MLTARCAEERCRKTVVPGWRSGRRGGRPGRRERVCAWAAHLSERPGQSTYRARDPLPWPVVPAEPTISVRHPLGTQSSGRPSNASWSRGTTAPRSATSPSASASAARACCTTFPSKDAPLRPGLRAAADRLGGPRRTDRPRLHEGWEKVVIVLTAGFRFEENPSYVRLMRREALDGGAHLEVSTWRWPAAAVQRGRRVSWRRRCGEGRSAPRSPPAAGHRLRRAPHVLQRHAPFLGGLLGADPLSPDMLRQRLDHVLDFFQSRAATRSRLRRHARACRWVRWRSRTGRGRGRPAPARPRHHAVACGPGSSWRRCWPPPSR